MLILAQEKTHGAQMIISGIIIRKPNKAIPDGEEMIAIGTVIGYKII